ncbi:MAG: hypothetical protein P8X96_09070 [Desulfobacteraceae bacterium]
MDYDGVPPDTVKQMNIEHRTPNVEQGMLPIYKMTERSDFILRRSMFDVGCSTFKYFKAEEGCVSPTKIEANYLLHTPP